MRKKFFIALIAFFAFLTIALLSLTAGSKKKGPKVLILGFDGMDPFITEKLISEGKLPNIEKLIKQGDFKKMLSSHPAQSPVAWSNFITGKDPGGHGIFDFIHRDPKTYMPVFSVTKTMSIFCEKAISISLFKFLIPVIISRMVSTLYSLSSSIQDFSVVG